MRSSSRRRSLVGADLWVFLVRPRTRLPADVCPGLRRLGSRITTARRSVSVGPGRTRARSAGIQVRAPLIPSAVLPYLHWYHQGRGRCRSSRSTRSVRASMRSRVRGIRRHLIRPPGCTSRAAARRARVPVTRGADAPRAGADSHRFRSPRLASGFLSLAKEPLPVPKERQHHDNRH